MSETVPSVPPLQNMALAVIARYRQSVGSENSAHAGSTWHIITLSHLIVGDLEAMLKGTDLSPADMFVMGVLMIEGNDARLRPSDVARVLSVTPAAISLRLAKLEAAGWVLRHDDPDDRRTVRLTLAPAGIDFVRGFLDRVATQGSFARALSKLSADEQGTLETLLRKLNLEMERHVIR